MKGNLAKMGSLFASLAVLLANSEFSEKMRRFLKKIKRSGRKMEGNLAKMGSLFASLAVLLANLECLFANLVVLFAKSRSLLANSEFTEKMRRFLKKIKGSGRNMEGNLAKMARLL
ncbi:hypothetical protein CVN76_20350 [Bacillus sp. mrc49]|nr:hypothetical protein CVN76_20350 [Bacillus sp. mrc49]